MRGQEGKIGRGKEGEGEEKKEQCRAVKSQKEKMKNVINAR